METIIQKVDREAVTEEELFDAAAVLQRGGLVAFPTETVYGLGGDALREDASAKIYEAKGRPSDNPLIVHIAEIKQLYDIAAYVPEKAEKLMEAFWPGPLTMIFRKKEIVPKSTTGGLETVAVRMPSHPVALALIRCSGCYIAAPSANTSGRPSPTKAEHVVEDLQGRIDMILDGGSVEIGLESTIVDMTEEVPMILRPGYITKEMLETVAGAVAIDPAVISRTAKPDTVAKAPGMKYRHYAPHGEMTIVEGEQGAVIKKIHIMAEEILQESPRAKLAVIASEETKGYYRTGTIFSLLLSGADGKNCSKAV